MKTKNPFRADEHGYYGEFGGAFIPEMLHANVEELQEHFPKIFTDESFQKEFRHLLADYVGRPSPLYLAERLSEKYGHQVFLKREDLNHTGSHKVNNAIGQVLIAKRLGKTKIIAETGAGQHGVATATVCALMGLECIVYMGAVDMQRQRLNVERMRMLGAEVRPAKSGNQTLKDATNEAMRHWISNPDSYYVIGSVVGPHPYPEMVVAFQSVISEEIRIQLKGKIGRETPDAVIACVGGGSNAAGAFYHFYDEPNVRLYGAEAAGMGIDTNESAATIALGSKGVLHGSMTILMQTKDGQVIEPYSISAGLDYPGIGPVHAHLALTGRGKYFPVTDREAMQAGLLLTRLEGIIPAIESAHAVAVLEKVKFDKNEVVVINLSGRGDKDMETYINYGKYSD